MASVPSMASTASTTPCCTTQAWPTSACPRARTTAAPRSISARAAASGASLAHLAARPHGLGQNLVRADDAEAFLPQHAHDRRKQPVIPGKGGTANPGHDPRPLGIGAEVHQRRTADRPDQHKLRAPGGAQPGQDLARSPHPDECVGIRADHGTPRQNPAAPR